jgi:hypothetical protein
MTTARDIQRQDDNAIAHMLAILPEGDPRRAAYESLVESDEDSK